MGYNASVFTVLTTEEFDRWLAKRRDRQARMKIAARMTSIELGNLGDAKSVGGTVSEMRINYGPGYRLYYTRKGLEIIVLLIGGDKSTQQSDIDKAISLAKQVRQ